MTEDSSLKKYALVSATGAAFLMPFLSSAVNIAIPSIGKQFNSTPFILGWIVTGYLLASAAFLLPFGRLADIVGRKKVFLAGLFIYTVFTLLCGMAQSVQMLIFFMVPLGMGSAMIFGTNMAILTSIFPPQERGKVIGLNVAAVYIGLTLGPVLGGFLDHNFGWTSIFFFESVLALFILLIASTRLKGEWTGDRDRFDLPGAVLYISGLVMFLYGISSLTKQPWARWVFAAGLVMFLLFALYAQRARSPLFNLGLFRRNATFAFSNLAAFINYSATFAVTFLLSLYLQAVKGYSSQSAGLVLLAQPVVMALLSPAAGALSDRVSPRLLASLGMTLTAASLFAFVFTVGQDTPIWMVVLNLLVLGAGFALFSSPNTNAVMGSVEKRYYGIASSTVGTMRVVGQAVSMALLTLIMSMYMGNVQLAKVPPETLVKSAKVSFIVFAALCAGGIFASLARGKGRVQEGGEV